jgi:hypothetical protein
MGETSRELKTELERGVARLQTLRDEIRVRMHLAGMDAKTEWNRLEPRLESVVERAAHEVTDASRRLVEETTEAVKRFRDSLKS